jgi:DNA-directed RNA polymerase specialized sigma24 family protein
MAAPPPFQVVLDAHGPALYRHLVGVLGPHDGADCFQETLLAALRAWPPRHDGNLRAWLFTVAHRKVIDHARATGRRAVPVGAVPERPAAGGGDDGDGPGGDVWDAVRTLPEKQRVAVALRHGEDWGYDEIAVVLGCTEAAARQSVKAGVDRLKEVLA